MFERNIGRCIESHFLRGFVFLFRSTAVTKMGPVSNQQKRSCRSAVQTQKLTNLMSCRAGKLSHPRNYANICLAFKCLFSKRRLEFCNSNPTIQKNLTRVSINLFETTPFCHEKNVIFQNLCIVNRKKNIMDSG